MTLEPLLWARCNQSLVAKIIGECAYEECWEPTPLSKGEYELVIGDRSYRFHARQSIWGWLQVDPESIRCQGQEVSSATEFLVNAQPDLKLNDIDLGNLLEEIQNTLYSTYRQQERLLAYTAGDMVQLPAEELQSLLDGHPKAIANKGRIGWGTEELALYAPESGQSVRLQLLLVHRSLCTVGYEPETDPWHLLQLHVSDEQNQVIDQLLKDRGTTRSEYYPVPVHPWQWQRHINVQYQAWIQSGDIIPVGELADDYLPQQSIRTFSNLRDRADYDIKLPLTILNTSCFRGIPGKHIETGADLSQWLSSIVSEDPLLSGLVVQREICGIHCRHPVQEQVAQTPYRYREMLGVVWRESLQKFVNQDEQGILMATLMQCDSRGKALVAEYIRRSGLAPEAWLRELFSKVVVPLYHLMAKYGVGLVAHGQNISVILRDHVPVRVSVKDFHGDLRIVDQDFPELADMPMQVKACLTRFPAKYLIHDLVTGHFVTTLRFISPLVEEQCGVTEARFYALLAESISKYQKQHPELAARYELFPMFTDTILKVCINRVRFRIGYADSAERPIPELGTPINNPLVLDRVTEHDYDTAS
ncbi:IucA/IucC family siderophore biosynthesis protein [Hahella sp. CCB-MM4]|uniref:IucA/IucC family protein n=1 Tax=Hahella sp. (strain CCB-MM4) TaxID=1926491 RepID=UPI00143D21D3|nr:IucA/IucC family siderophore biosynthesis protein [Hahella sp. CCB-MM4]